MFEWKSGDDDEWVDEGTAVPERTSTRFTGKVRGLLVGLVLCLLLLAGLGVLYRGVDTRVTAVTNTVEQEILAADRLLVEAATDEDAELFAVLLRPSPTWTEIQTRLQARDTFFNRPPLGLWLDTRTDLFAAEILSNTHFTISPDLNRAELIRTMPYITLDEAREVQPLLLQHTAVYQRQGNSWLLAEPDDAFWGNYVHEVRPYLDLIAPARDQEIAARLADDLNGWIRRICQEIDCPTEFVLQMRLSNDPQSLLELYSPVRLTTVYLGGQQTTRLSLPAPTLVGLPTDEAGYAALQRAYATHLAQALLNAYGFNAPTAVLGGTINNPDFEPLLAGWGLFSPWPAGYNPIRSAEPPPIPLPQQDILLLCYGSRAPNLFRYDTTTNVWFDVSLATEGIVNLYMTPFPKGQGVVLVIGPSTRDALFRVVWLHNGREHLLFTTTVWPSITFVTEVEPGRFLLSYNAPMLDESNLYQHQAVLFSAADCDDQACTVQPFEQWVQPSPDGRATLITRRDEIQGFTYALGNAAGEEVQLLENAYNPFWLDGRTLVYLQVASSAEADVYAHSTVMSATLIDANTVEIETLLTADDVAAMLPNATFSGTLLINGIMGYPSTQAEQLFVNAIKVDNSDPAQRSGFVLHYDWQTETLSTLPGLGSEPLDLSWWSAQTNGRYLMIRDPLAAELRLYNIAAQSWQVYEEVPSRFYYASQHVWSTDGNWFVLPETDGVRLIAPDQNYEKFLFHGLDFCESALWVDRFSVAESGP